MMTEGSGQYVMRSTVNNFPVVTTQNVHHGGKSLARLAEVAGVPLINVSLGEPLLVLQEFKFISQPVEKIFVLSSLGQLFLDEIHSFFQAGNGF